MNDSFNQKKYTVKKEYVHFVYGQLTKKNKYTAFFINKGLYYQLTVYHLHFIRSVFC